MLRSPAVLPGKGEGTAGAAPGRYPQCTARSNWRTSQLPPSMRTSAHQVSLEPVPVLPTPSPSFAAALTRDGHKVILEKIEDWNVVELMVNEEIVFHCNIKDLEFGKSFSAAPNQPFAFSEACSISSG